MNPSARVIVVGAYALVLASTLVASAQTDPPPAIKCDQIAGDVRAAIEKEPGKLLMVVEDALVINESCACEIVKAAIQASKADEATSKQIVQTAIAVAPKMASVINECVASLAPGAAVDAPVASTTSGKEPADIFGDKNPQPATTPDDAGSDFQGGMTQSVRGVYLIAPAASGYVTTTTEEDTTGDHPTQPRSNRKRHYLPVSPSTSTPDPTPTP